jgi:Arc/MetJ-type ribon-helix-helix transcriptional regulator
MTVELKPETERLVREEIQRGHVHSVDELIQLAVQALREKHPVEPSPATAPPRKPRKNLADFLIESPFAGSELDLERQKDYPRDLDL